MFGVGIQELLVIGLIALLIFGPHRLPQMARELGRFASEARYSLDEFRSELSTEEDNEDVQDLEELEEERGVSSED